MHLVLTDKLSCPRCGPESGLVLLADRIENRRVLEGSLDCADCMARYPIRGGFVDFRTEPGPARSEDTEPGEWAHRDENEATAGSDRAESDAGTSSGPDRSEEALRLAALLGITEGTDFVLIAGPGARLAPTIADRLEGIEVVTVDSSLAGWPERPGVSRIGIDPPDGRGSEPARALPFKRFSMRGVALTGPAASWPVEEAARVVAPVGRLVLDGAPPDAAEGLERAGLEIAARDERTIVARRVR